MICNVTTGTTRTGSIKPLLSNLLGTSTVHLILLITTCPLRIHTPTRGLGFGGVVLIEPSNMIPVVFV